MATADLIEVAPGLVRCPFTILIDKQEKAPFSFDGLRARSFVDREMREYQPRTERRFLGIGMGDYSIETFNPIVSGNLDGKATYLVENPVKQDPVRMTESVEKYDETLVTQELKTLNMMIEDWTIIRDVNAYLHSTPQEFAKLAKFNYFELDAFQLNLVNRELSRKKDEIFVREMANRPDAYKIRYGADGNQRIMTGDKW